MIADHEKPPVSYLNHFMTVQDWMMSTLAGCHPFFVNLVPMAGVTDQNIFFRVWSGLELLRPSGHGSGTKTGEKVAACLHWIWVNRG
jgi:hypothetical protein